MTTMTPGANIPLAAPQVVVEVTAPRPLDVSALLVTTAGKVRSDADFVFFNQPTGPGVSHRPASAGVPDAITVHTAAVPADIDKVVVTASLDGGAAFAGTEPTATVRNAADGTVLATFTPPRLSTETALVVAEVYRRQGAWKLRAVGQGYANGLAGIATDFGVTVDDAPAPSPAPAPAQAPPPPPAPGPAAPPQPPTMPQAPVPAPGGGFAPQPTMPQAPQAPQPPMPQAPMPPAPGGYGPPPPQPGYPSAPQPPSGYPSAPQPPHPPQPAPQPTAPAAGGAPVNLDKGRVNLAKNQTVSLVKGGRPVLSVVRMGLGWEPAYRGRNIDLDASVIAYDANRKKVATVWFMKLSELDGSIQHSGDNLTGHGDGDDEVITVDLGRIPPKVSGLVFVVNSFSGQKFNEVAKAYCRLLNGSDNAELVRFDLTNAEARTGVVMCKLVRQYSGEWQMTAVGEYVDAKTVRGMVKPAAAML